MRHRLVLHRRHDLLRPSRRPALIAPVIIVVAGVLLSSCAPLLVGGLVGGAIVAHQHYRRDLCRLPNGVWVHCQRHYWAAHRRHP